MALTIATSEQVAWAIANRRIQESFAPFAKYAIKFIRDFKSMLPGDVVRHPTLGDLRLIETRFDANSPTTEGLFVQDVYGLSASYTDPDDGSDGGGDVGPPIGDVLFRVFEVPRSLLQRGNYTGTQTIFSMMRVRKRNSVTRATLYRGASVLELAVVTSTTKRQFGGFLVNEIPAGSRYIEGNSFTGEGIIIDIFGSAFDDLTAEDKRKHAIDLAAWVPTTTYSDSWSGGITLLIGSTGNEEICYAKYMQPYQTETIDGKTGLVTKWLVRGLVRARHQTKARNHQAGVHVYAFKATSANQVPLAVPGTIAPGLPAYHKSRAANANGQQISLTASPNSTITIDGKWLKAIPIQFIRFGEKVRNYNAMLGTATPEYRGKMAPHRAARILDTYAVNDSGVVSAAIVCELSYPSKAYAVGAGGSSHSSPGASGATAAPATRNTQDKFVLEVWFVPYDTTTSARGTPIMLRQQTVADSRSSAPSGQSTNHANYRGTVAIDYSATMHEEDRALVQAFLQNNSQYSVNRLPGENDLGIGWDETTIPVIGDKGLEAGNPPIFYTRIVHSMYDAPSGEESSRRYYYSYHSELTYRFGKPLYNNASGWHTSDYNFLGDDGGEY